ncbi:hypothetical protein F5148DRAFT_1153512, partial [Russula earlei]
SGCPPLCRHAAIKLGPKRQCNSPFTVTAQPGPKPATGSFTCAVYDRNRDHRMAQAATSFARIDQHCLHLDPNQPFRDNLYRRGSPPDVRPGRDGQGDPDDAARQQVARPVRVGCTAGPWRACVTWPAREDPSLFAAPTQGRVPRKTCQEGPTALTILPIIRTRTARPPPPDALASPTKATSGTRRERTRRAAAARLPAAAAASASAMTARPGTAPSSWASSDNDTAWPGHGNDAAPSLPPHFLPHADSGNHNAMAMTMTATMEWHKQPPRGCTRFVIFACFIGKTSQIFDHTCLMKVLNVSWQNLGLHKDCDQSTSDAVLGEDVVALLEWVNASCVQRSSAVPKRSVTVCEGKRHLQGLGHQQPVKRARWKIFTTVVVVQGPLRNPFPSSL